MASFTPQLVKCPCGHVLRVDLAESINVARTPRFRDDILAGTLHQTVCSACRKKLTVEKEFYYVDPGRDAHYLVRPRNERHLWRAGEAALGEVAQALPALDHAYGTGARRLRVVYGLDELREKLVIEDAELDDHLVEFVKAMLVREHPVLLDRPRLRLSLEGHSAHELRFAATYEHHPDRFALRIPRPSPRLLADESATRAHVRRAQPNGPLFDDGAGWVNLWRLSPQPDALHGLKTLAAALRAGERVDMGADAVGAMLGRLPRGNHLAAWAKKDLDVLFEAAQKQRKDETEALIFSVRFDHALSDDWARNDKPNDIPTLWQIFKALPPRSVELNSELQAIRLADGGSVYDPSSNDITIGSDDLRSARNFRLTVRHEVGHALQDKLGALADQFVEDEFGWKTFDLRRGPVDAHIDAWVGLMGGWGHLSSDERRDVRQRLRDVVQGTEWEAVPLLDMQPPGHPWYGDGFGPRLALEMSSARRNYWFDNYKHWHTHEGVAFCVNFWYGTLMAVPVETLKLVARMPRSYAAMSPQEFFADMYAVVVDPEAPRPSIFRPEVRRWFKDHA